MLKRLQMRNLGIYMADFQETDGLITDKRGKVLSLCYADCIPLFFYDPVTEVIRKCTLWLERNISGNCKNCGFGFKEGVWCRP